MEGKSKRTGRLHQGTFIWLRADSFKPVISRTFTQVVMGLPLCFDESGCHIIEEALP